MSKELIVATGRHETRVAILEDDQLVEVFHEREKEYSLAGSIHKGRVTRVLPGMQSAFVDIGLERDAFLYVSDFFEDNDEYDAVVSTAEEKVLKLEKGGSSSSSQSAAASGASSEAPAVEGSAAETLPGESRAQAQPQRESRPSGEREHGRRGRRGRRRGGRGSGGIPESKYFSPGAERHAAPVETASEPQAAEHEADQDSGKGFARSSEPEVHERIILPGESLAKYSGAERENAPVEIEEVEPAIPVDHHLAGLSWTTPASGVSETAAVEAAAAVEAPKAVEDDDRPQLIPTPDAPPAESLSAEDEDVILAAAEAVEAIQEEAIEEITVGSSVSDHEMEDDEDEPQKLARPKSWWKKS